MAVTVKIPTQLRAVTNGEAEAEADGSTVGEVLRGLAERHSATESQLFSEEGELNRYVNVYLNDEDVRVLDGLDTPLSGSDTLMILPAMAGGGEAPGQEGGMPSARTERGHRSPRK